MSIIKPLLLCTLLAVTTAAWADDRINLNSADADTLATSIVGIGPAKGRCHRRLPREARPVQVSR